MTLNVARGLRAMGVLIFLRTATDLLGLRLGALFLLIHITPWKAAGSRAGGTRQAS